MKKILFQGLGPCETVSCGAYHGLKNGDIALMKGEHALAYIQMGWAKEVVEEKEIERIRTAETKRAQNRKRIVEKVGKINEC